MGQIPIGTQLQGFSASSFAGNPRLCGAPLQINCTGQSGNVHVSKQHGGSNDDVFETESLYLGMVVGFAAGFWWPRGSLFLNKTWRHAYGFLNYVADEVHVLVPFKFNSFIGMQPSSL